VSKFQQLKSYFKIDLKVFEIYKEIYLKIQFNLEFIDKKCASLLTASKFGHQAWLTGKHA